MFIPFDKMAGHSRVWIYQSTRAISLSERNTISAELEAFTDQWLVHGSPMKASYAIFYNQFIVLAADEGFNAASGCSIDGSVRKLKALGEQLNLDFFDRTRVAFKEGENIKVFPLASLKQAYAEGLWRSDSSTFNNLVATIDELKTSWIVPAHETWLRKYLSIEPKPA